MTDYRYNEPKCAHMTAGVAIECTSECMVYALHFFFFSSRRRHTRFDCDWSSDVCSSDLLAARDLLRRNRDGGPRRSRFTLDRRQLRSVQERRGLPCYECGTTIDVGFHPKIGRASCRERV